MSQNPYAPESDPQPYAPEAPPFMSPPMAPGQVGMPGRPHRGGIVLTLGLVGLLSSLFSCACCVFLAPIGLVCSILARVFGAADLKAMRREEVDRTGEGTTRAGWILRIIGTVIGALALIGIIRTSAASSPWERLVSHRVDHERC